MVTMPAMTPIKACVFDAYGTLFDVHSAVDRQRTRLGSDAGSISALWRTKQLEYTWLRSLMRRHTDFWHITQDALDYALDSFDVDDAGLRNDLMQAYLQLSCYPEVPEVLTTLRQNGMRSAILSNGSPRMLQAAVANAGIADRLDQVLSVEDVGIFKPDPKVYQLAVDILEVAPHEICFQSSNAWDAAGAASFGFRVVWINRFGQRRERLPAQPDSELTTLRELPPLLGL
jgi:2-haloacid dehalogenase